MADKQSSAGPADHSTEGGHSEIQNKSGAKRSKMRAEPKPEVSEAQEPEQEVPAPRPQSPSVEIILDRPLTRWELKKQARAMERRAKAKERRDEEAAMFRARMKEFEAEAKCKMAETLPVKSKTQMETGMKAQIKADLGVEAKKGEAEETKEAEVQAEDAYWIQVETEMLATMAAEVEAKRKAEAKKVECAAPFGTITAWDKFQRDEYEKYMAELKKIKYVK